MQSAELGKVRYGKRSRGVKCLMHYYGGKNKMLSMLVGMIPKHVTYVEVFGGAATLLFNKSPSKVEIYNDIDNRLVTLFRVLQREELFNRLERMLYFTLYSRAEYERARKIYAEGSADPVELAWAVYVAIRQGFAGRPLNGWGYSITTNRAKIYCRRVDYSPWFHERLRHVQIERDDAFDVIKRYDSKGTFFFLDPPYPPSTLRDPKSCPHYMSEEQHIRLAETLKQIRGKFLLTTYRTDYYDQMGVFYQDVETYVTAMNARKSGSRLKEYHRLYYNYELDGMGNLDLYYDSSYETGEA